MKLQLLLHSEQYAGSVLLGIYNSRGNAEMARDVYLKEDETNDPESLQIVEVSMNEKPDWNFTNPSLQEFYKNSLVSWK